MSTTIIHFVFHQQNLLTLAILQLSLEGFPNNFNSASKFYHGLCLLETTSTTKKMTYFMIIVLSLSDLGVGVISLPLFTVMMNKRAFTGRSSCTMCMVYVYCGHTFQTMSWSTLLTMNIEILSDQSDEKKTLTRLIAIWVDFLLIKCLQLLSHKIEILVVSIHSIIIILAIGFVHARIFHTSQNVLNKTNFAKITFLRTLRDVKSCLIDFLSFLACHTPSLLILLMGERVHISSSLSSWGALLPLMNSSINSVVFFWRDGKLRKEAWKILKKVFTK